jgi:hypothetical protein
LAHFMKTIFYPLLCALLFSGVVSAPALDFEQAKSLADAFQAVGRFSNSLAIERQVDQEIQKQSITINRDLASCPGQGVLFDVPIYAFAEGYKLTTGVEAIGVGHSPSEVALANLRYRDLQGSLSSGIPPGSIFDENASFLIWLTKEGSGFKKVRYTGPHRSLVWSAARTRLDQENALHSASPTGATSSQPSSK